jgi:putative RecB family exonuclease
MGTYLQCPLLYKLTKVDKLDEGDTTDTLRGKYVHEVLEFLFRDYPAEERTFERAKVLLRERWDAEWGQAMVQFFGRADERELRQFRWESFWRVENYFTLEDPSTVIPEDAEAYTETKISGLVAGVQVLGFVDRWYKREQGITVTDYKTGKTPKKRYQRDKFLQLWIYADYLATQEDMPIEKIELLFLKDAGRISEPGNEAGINHMRETLVSVRNSVDADFKEGRFEPRTSILCDWCNFKSECPAYRS